MEGGSCLALEQVFDYNRAIQCSVFSVQARYSGLGSDPRFSVRYLVFRLGVRSSVFGVQCSGSGPVFGVRDPMFRLGVRSSVFGGQVLCSGSRTRCSVPVFGSSFQSRGSKANSVTIMTARKGVLDVLAEHAGGRRLCVPL